jgi:hypothetical protein
LKNFTRLAALLGAFVFVSVALAGGKPAVRFTSPTASATTGSTVTFKVKLTNFRIDAKHVGMQKMANRGHLHFAMDGGKYDYPRYSGANGKLAVKLGIAGKYSPSVTPSITYKHLPRGKHRLVVTLAENDHSAAGARASIRFTVR